MTVVVVCHDMRRQALRTLFSLSRDYQRGIEDLAYEVLVIDNGSRRPLTSEEVAACGPEFRHESFPAATPSPCAALNHGVRQARFPRVMVLIDGARLLSPGLLALATRALALARHPFVFTLGMHLGPKVHNELVAEGFTPSDEERLLDSVSWRTEGYRLFEISSVALSSREGFFSELTESNCVALEIGDYERLGGFDERFVAPGGGLANLDFFNRALASPALEPIMLLGEATFHQQHGGVATEAPLAAHPWPRFVAEYEAIHGRSFGSVWRRPRYFGPYRAQGAKLYPDGWRAAAEFDGAAGG
jgi:hypothetical protein